MKYNNETLIDVYTPYHSDVYLPSNVLGEKDFIVKVSEDLKDPNYTPVPYRVISSVNKNTELFKNRVLRFRPEEEEELWKDLRIDNSRIRDVYTKEAIDKIILTPTDEELKNVLKIKSLSMINCFFSELVWLRNSGNYWVNEKAELYIRARRDEIRQGIAHTELPFIEDADEEDINELLGIEPKEEVEEEEIVEEVVEEVKPKTANKKTTTAKKTTTKKTTK